LLFHSGAAAIFAAVVSQLQAGDHVICVQDAYTWAKKLFTDWLPRFQVETTFVDGRDSEAVIAAQKSNTRLLYLESPTSVTFHVQDLETLCQWAKQNHIRTILDNSYCTSLYQQPIRWGVDLVIQSATKYISGHSDVLAGVVCGPKAMLDKMFFAEYMTVGSGITPLTSWLLLRGLRTLPIRLKQSSESVWEVMNYLKQHPAVEKVYYPLDPQSPQYERASKYMSGAGGLFSFVLRSSDREAIEDFCNRLQHFLMAVSWGGYESLLFPQCAVLAHEAFDPSQERHRMIRMYVGLEEPSLLIRDLEQALEHLT
jgi:cystathionine beta-lyase/cystathionine gamma-synthase